MKFFSEKKDTLSVISKVAKKRIALFENGEFETNDPELIKKLKSHFRHESPKVLSGLVNFMKLKEEAKKKGINTFKMKKKDIEKALNLKEGE